MCESALTVSCCTICIVLRNDLLNLFEVEECEQSQKSLDVFVTGIHEVLVDRIRRIFLIAQPDCIAFRFAKLFAGRVENQWSGHPIDLITTLLAGEFYSSNDISPLVRTGDLEIHSLVGMQPIEVVPLEEHIAELGKRDRLVRIFNPFLYRLFIHHLVDGDELANFS